MLIEITRDLNMMGFGGDIIKVVARSGQRFQGEYRPFGSKQLMVALREDGNMWLSEGDWKEVTEPERPQNEDAP